jgi:diguanylate cyclase (GGDEF)-like protein
MLAQSTRASDLAARYGGEEFVVIAPGCPLAASVILASRFRSLLTEKSIIADGVRIAVTASIGIATAAMERRRDSPLELIRRADQALYQAKRSGRDSIWVFDQSQPGPTQAAASGK